VSEEPYDSRFTLPAIDAPADAEVGVILLGLDVDRLLAGLGFAHFADDPALVTQAVDQARHGTFTTGMTELAAAGLARWRAVRALIEAEPGKPEVGSLRQEWANSFRRVAGAVAGSGPAALTYLTACWIRRTEVDRLAASADEFPAGKEELDVLPEVPAG
jgi:hypothetical protein